MIFVVINDPHLSDKPPVNRKDSYVDEIMDKIEESVNVLLFSEDSDRRVVILGDLFHRKRPDRTSHSLVQRVMSLFVLCRTNGIKVEIVVGNHDISGGSLSTLERQPLGDFSAVCDVVPYVGSFFDVVPGTTEFMGDEIVSNFEDIEPVEDILMAHMPIARPEETPIWPHISSRHSHFQNWKYVFYGHIHDYHGIYTLGNTTFINLGGISRGSISEVSLDRTIQVPVCNYNDGGLKIEPHTLKCVKPAKDVFKILEVTRKKVTKSCIDTFTDALKSTTVDLVSLDGVNRAMKEMTDDKEVLDEAAEILEEVWE